MRSARRHIFKSTLASVLAGAALALAAAPASATDFCLNISDPACPAGASFASDVEDAMEMHQVPALAKDGVPDRVFIPSGAQLPSNGVNFFPYETGADFSLNDDLEVIGAGRDSTILTTNTSSNVYVVLLNNMPNRKVTMRDLTIRAPASFPDSGPAGFGSILQEEGDVFRRVNFESRNPVAPNHSGTSGVNVLRGGTFDDVRFFGTAGGGFGQAFSTGQWFPGNSLEITDSDIVDFSGGITYSSNPGLPVHITRSHFRSDFGTVLGVYNALSSIENSVVEAGQTPPFFVQATTANTDNANLVVKNSTILNLGGSSVAFDVAAGNTAVGSAGLGIYDSIVYGFEKSWTLAAGSGPGVGDANLDIAYSNIENQGVRTGGDGFANTANNNISQNPGFVGFNDYHLSPSSPSIDAGSPSPGGLLDDIEGSVRPLDGNGDGVAVRDQGAYEAPTLPTCSNDPSLCPPPKITALKAKKITKKAKTIQFRFKSSKAARVKFTFKPTGGKKPKRKTARAVKKAKAGANSFKVRKKKLKPGRYLITIVATDSQGNKSTARVKAVYLKSGKKFNVQKN